MMPWREGLIVSLGLLVGGCFLPAYQIASWTATGVSYVFSGKGVGDHALSLAMNQDCATMRVLGGQQLCVDYGRDFENSWEAMVSTWKVPGEESDTGTAVAVNSDEPGGNATSTLKKPTVTLLAVAAIEDAGQPPLVVTRTAISKSQDAVKGIDFDGLVVPEWAVGQRQDASWRHNAFVPRSLDLGGLVRVERREDLTADRPQVKTQETEAKPVIFVVMGSFGDRHNAERLRAEHAKFRTVVSEVVSDDRTMYRLLAGPVRPNALTGLRVDLAKAGIRNSWAVKLCRGSLTTPPCKSSVQQAALP